MRGAAVVLVALASRAAAAGRLPRQREAPPAPRRAAGRRPVRVAPRGATSLRVLPRTPAVTVHVPDGLRAGVRVPLVLGLQGAGQDARGFEAESNLSNVADEHHFVVAYPMSWRARGFWHYPEPDNPRSALRLLRATLDAVGRAACVDRGRVLVTGISSGGRITYGAGCSSPTGSSPSRRSRAARANCRPAIPHGRSRSSTCTGPRTRSSPTAAAALATTGACATSWPTGPARGLPSRAAQARRIDPDVTRLDWPACRGDVRVAHLRIDGGRHAWPPLGGPPGIGIDGAEEIWRFFAALPTARDEGRVDP